MEEFEFELQYFKPSGKFYSEGKLKTQTSFVTSDGGAIPAMYQACDRVKELQQAGKLPGLAVGAGASFYIYVNHCNGYPCLIMPLVTE